MLNEKLPQYLDELKEPKEYFGELIREKERYVIKASPEVTQMIKGLFPLTEVSEGGIAHFPINKRQIGNLNWFMMRFPLKIINPILWKRDLKEAKEYYLKKEEIKSKISYENPNIRFKGELFDFQKLGLSFLINNKRCLLADEMGLGKTVMALAFISKQKFPMLIVVPPHLLIQWESEIKKFLGEETKVQILRGLDPKKNPIKQADIYLIHYLIIRNWKKELTNMDFETIIFDEIQELRHSGSKKYFACEQIAESKENIIGLSGTPIYNYGSEIWNVMNIIEPYCLGEWRFFTKEWCTFYGGGPINKPEQLGKYLIDEGLMLRRRKEEVLTELPPKRKITQKIDLNQELYVNLIEKSIQISVAIPTMVTKEEKRLIGSMVLDAVNNARRASGIAKAGHVCDFVKLILDSGEPCLLFAYHHDVVNIYLSLLQEYSPYCITGRETMEEKSNAIKKFMDGRTNLLIINLRTTSGLNLQRAKCVVFGELDWSPAIHKQAEDRIHRIGQKDSVLAYYLVAPTASDQEISAILGLKEEQFIGLMKDKPETEQDKILSQRSSNEFMGKIISNLRNGFKDNE